MQRTGHGSTQSVRAPMRRCFLVSQKHWNQITSKSYRWTKRQRSWTNLYANHRDSQYKKTFTNCKAPSISTFQKRVPCELFFSILFNRVFGHICAQKANHTLKYTLICWLKFRKTNQMQFLNVLLYSILNMEIYANYLPLFTSWFYLMS